MHLVAVHLATSRRMAVAQWARARGSSLSALVDVAVRTALCRCVWQLCARVRCHQQSSRARMACPPTRFSRSVPSRAEHQHAHRSNRMRPEPRGLEKRAFSLDGGERRAEALRSSRCIEPSHDHCNAERSRPAPRPCADSTATSALCEFQPQSTCAAPTACARIRTTANAALADPRSH